MEKYTKTYFDKTYLNAFCAYPEKKRIYKNYYKLLKNLIICTPFCTNNSKNIKMKSVTYI